MLVNEELLIVLRRQINFDRDQKGQRPNNRPQLTVWPRLLLSKHAMSLPDVKHNSISFPVFQSIPAVNISRVAAYASYIPPALPNLMF
jgi:hypothetical protein